MARPFRSLLLAASGLLLFAVTAELVFRALPVSTATATSYHIDPMILTYPPHQQIGAATGWDLRNAQRLRTNNLGFVSDIDFTPDPQAVALIGDSYVEASMLAANERLGAQLQQRLGPQRPVYAMGNPGTSLLDYAERVRYASQKLAVRDFVIFVVKGDVHHSLCGSANIDGPCLNPKTLAPDTDLRPPPGRLKQIVRQSALAQYLFSQVRVSPDKLLPALKALPASLLPGHAEPAPAGPGKPTPATAPEVVDLIAKTFLDRVRPHVAGRLVLVINSPPPGTRGEAPDDDNRRFAAIAAARGATVVEMQAAYQAHARRSGLSLAVGPYDGHLNALGMSLVADVAAAAFRTAKPWPEAPEGVAPASR